jgi:hypothetical protein
MGDAKPQATQHPPLPQELLLSPAPFSARCALTQQGRSGQDRLHWHSEDRRYALRLERWPDDGRPLHSWHGRGRWDTRGLAPEHFATAERGREKQATSFRWGIDQFLVQHGAAGPHPRGGQDRLSWWLQLTRH